MTVYQFAFNQNNIITRLGDENITLSRPPTILDCREYMTGCFSESPTRNHPDFARCVNDGLSMHEEHGSVAVGCQQGKHRSRAVAQEIGSRLKTKVVRL